MQSTRTFQVWSYSVSHSQLLLRSNRTGGLGTRAEVLFKGVDAFELQTVNRGLDISELPIEQAPTYVKDLLKDEDELRCRVYGGHSDGFTGYVVAIAVFHVEDHGEYFTPSSLYAPSGI